MKIDIQTQHESFSKPAAGRFLIGRPGFFFEPPNGPGNTGAPSQGNLPAQNQPAEPAPIPDPFEGMDIDLLDDATRTRIVKAKEAFAIVANTAKQASTFQSERDRLQNELAETQRQVKEAADPRNQRQHQQPSGQHPQQPQTVMEETEAYYIEQGIDAATAKNLAKLNSPLFEKMTARTIAQVDQRYTPIVANTLERSADDAFGDAQQNDRVGALQIPDIAQRVYDRAKEMATNGQIVNGNVLSGLAKIYYVDYLEANGGQLPDQNIIHLQPSVTQSRPPVMNPHPVNPPTNINTRHTYPGAGNFARQPQQQPSGRNDAPILSADEQAAMAATVKDWPVKPKAYRTAAR